MSTVSPCVELAGFAAAHALCVVAVGHTLPPIVMSQCGTQTGKVNLLAGRTPEEIAADGARWLDENPEAAEQAVTVVDGYITVGGVRTDALLLDIRSYCDPIVRLKMAVPYRPARGPSAFAVHPPKFIVAESDSHDSAGLTRAFFSGVFKHGPGSRIWNASLDQTW